MSTENTKQAVIYARASTETTSTTLEDQEALCRRFAVEQGFQVVQVVRDTASGATLDRPGPDTVRSLASTGQVQAVITTEQDRLSRTLSQAELLRDEFGAAGADLHLVNQPTDASPEGYLASNIRTGAGAGERA